MPRPSPTARQMARQKYKEQLRGQHERFESEAKTRGSGTFTATDTGAKQLAQNRFHFYLKEKERKIQGMEHQARKRRDEAIKRKMA